MKLQNILLEGIKHLDEETQRLVIQEAPHVPFVCDIPEELYPLTLGSYTDFGVDDYQVTGQERTTILRAFSGTGIAVPGTKYKVRATPLAMGVIEVIDGSEPSLPEDWRRYIQVINPELKEKALVWFGKLVRSDRRPPNETVATEFVEDGQGFKGRS